MATIILKFETEKTDAASIKNAVRRAFDGAQVSDETGEIKGVQYKIKERKVRPARDTQASKARAWARKQGLPVGARGRLRPEILAAFLSA